MQRFLKDQEGTVTLFLVIILGAVFLFCAVLIDYSRIMAASKETENAAQAGVRSVLASYNSKIQPYGLYGGTVDNQQANQIFQKIIENSLAGGTAEGQYQYINNLMDASGTMLVIPQEGYLSNAAIFEQQILEDMKYKAPIQVTLELLTNAKNGAEQAQISQSAQLMEVADKLGDLSDEREKDLNELLKDYQIICSDLEDLGAKDAEPASDDPEEQKKEQQLRQETQTQIQQEIQAARRHFDAAQTKNNEMINLIADNNAAISGGNTDPALQTGCDPSYFSAYAKEIDRLSDYAAANSLGEGDIAAINLMLNKREQIEEKREQQLEQSKQDAENKALNAVTEETGDTSPEMVDPSSIDNIAKSLTGGSDIPQALQERIDRYKVAESHRIQLSSDPVEASQTAMLSAGKLLTGQNFTSIFYDIRNELYVNEYALMYLNYYTVNNSGNDRLSILRSTHPIHKEEVEYCIYGIKTPKENFIAASGEIYAIRLALRTAQGWQKFSYIPDIRVRAIAAATFGVIMAAKDLKTLLSGGKVPIYGKGSFDMTYKDYLRLFLLQPDDTQKLRRIQALIDLDTGTDLTIAPAYVKGTARSAIRMWFMSGITDSLGITQAGSYSIEKTAAMYY